MTEPTAGVTLACPQCGNTTLTSAEVATIGYPAVLRRDAAGVIQVDYTGDSYEVYDEGTKYAADIWCTHCGDQLTEGQLVPVPVHEMRPCGCSEDICPPPGHCTDCGERLAWDGKGGYAHASEVSA